MNVVNAILGVPTVMLCVCPDSVVQEWGDIGLSHKAPARPTLVRTLPFEFPGQGVKGKDESCRRDDALNPIPAAPRQNSCAGRAGHCPWVGGPSAKMKEESKKRVLLKSVTLQINS